MLKPFTLTSIELACGVTIEDVKREVPRLMLRDSGATVIVDATLPPALCNALARFAFGDHEFDTPTINRDLGLAIYRLA